MRDQLGPTVPLRDAINQILAYVQFPAMSIGIAASILGAQAIGGGRAHQLGAITRTALILNTIITGIGVIRNGEGVYGLRRAFFLAGAETLVMSLWPVSDLVTRDVMTGYYSGLKDGLGRGAALRRAQLRLMRQPGRRHPFYWASFIQAGEWANLAGQR